MEEPSTTSHARERRRGVFAASVLTLLVARLFFGGVEAAAPGCTGARLLPCRLDPRRCSWREVALIPGIGDALARRIAAALRRARVLEDLLAVDGVGPATLERLRRHVETPLALAPPVVDDPASRQQHAPVPRETPDHRRDRAARRPRRAR